MRYGTFTPDVTGQLAPTAAFGGNPGTVNPPRSMAGNPSMDHPSSFATGGPQGASMEPSDLQSYTLYVLFEDGKVTKLGINPE